MLLPALPIVGVDLAKSVFLIFPPFRGHHRMRFSEAESQLEVLDEIDTRSEVHG